MLVMALAMDGQAQDSRMLGLDSPIRTDDGLKLDAVQREVSDIVELVEARLADAIFLKSVSPLSLGDAKGFQSGACTFRSALRALIDAEELYVLIPRGPKKVEAGVRMGQQYSRTVALASQFLKPSSTPKNQNPLVTDTSLRRAVDRMNKLVTEFTTLARAKERSFSLAFTKLRIEEAEALMRRSDPQERIIGRTASKVQP